jgi:anti-sigma B factor antagonist
MFDEVTYHRNVGRNVLVVRKKLISKAEASSSHADVTAISAIEVGRHPHQSGQDIRRVNMSVESRRNGAVMIVTPQARFDTNSAPEVERVLTDHIESGERRIVLDLSSISYISSIGLRVILKAVMAMIRTGGRVVLCGGNDQVRTVLQLSGATIMSLYAATLEEALSRVEELR